MKCIKAIEILYQSLSDELAQTLRKSGAYVHQLEACGQKCDALIAQLPEGKESDELTAYIHAVAELEDMARMEIFAAALKLGMNLSKELTEKQGE